MCCFSHMLKSLLAWEVWVVTASLVQAATRTGIEVILNVRNLA